jgi:hypothetical protein
MGGVCTEPPTSEGVKRHRETTAQVRDSSHYQHHVWPTNQTLNDWPASWWTLVDASGRAGWRYIQLRV